MADRIALALANKRKLLSAFEGETVDVGAFCFGALLVVVEQIMKQPNPEAQLEIAHKQLDEAFLAYRVE